MMPRLRPIAFPTALLAMIVMVGCQSTRPSDSGDGPPTTDIWLFEMNGSEVTFLDRVTDREGYDNQPMFVGEGRMLFVSTRDGRANIYRYDVDSGESTRLTFTDADKYSPTLIPGTGGTEFSVVHTDTDADSGSGAFQGLWRYSMDNRFEPGPVAEVDAVAYYTWADNDRVLFWRLTDPPTVQVLDTRSSESTVVREDSAYSFKRAPMGGGSAYLAVWAGEHAEIRSFDVETGESATLAPALAGGRDFAWHPDGRLLMMRGGELYAFDPESSVTWERLADLGIRGGSRLAVSPNGSMLAVVGTRE